MAKILVVDDEMGIRELLSEILDDEGHEILLAENAATARLAYARPGIDLVLLDIWMPDTDGMTLLREWTTLQSLHCPVIMMSGHASVDTALEAQNLGASGFLEKPITLHKLLATVHKALHRAATAQHSSPTVVSPAPAAATATPLDEANTFAAPALADAGVGASVGTGTAATSAAGTLAYADHAHATVNRVDSLNPPDTHASQNSAALNIDLRAGFDATHSHETVGMHSPPKAVNAWQYALAQVSLDTDLHALRETVERIYFNYILESEQWGMTRVAERAGLERTHLYRKLKQLNIELSKRIKPSASLED
jgi:DNA-binding NtrC family response regulator